MNPKAICADMAFHHPHDMHDRTTYTMAKPSWDGCTIVQEVSLGTRGIQPPKNLDQTALAQLNPAQVDAQGSNGEKYTGDLKW